MVFPTVSHRARTAGASKIRSERHLTQLDGLRTVAIAAVIWSHWASQYQFGIPFGTGVQLFFVISGFLITGILLDNRVETGIVGIWRRFYARRALRIFPIFYLTIFVALIFNAAPVRATWPWHVSYLSNFYFVHRGDFDPPPDFFGPFWSLSVEEQFYLVWPFLVLIMPMRWIRPTLLCVILAAPLSRIISNMLISNDFMVHILPWSNLDSLGVGSLFAFLMRNANGSCWNPTTVGKICLWVGLPLSLIGVAGHRVSYVLYTIGHTGLILFYGWIVFQGAKGFPGAIGSFLANKVVVYIGKISYGLYVFHIFAAAIAAFLCAHLDLAGMYDRHLPFRFVANLVILFTLAMLSWHFFEKPLNDLKRFIPYKPGARPMAGKTEGVNAEQAS